jgi:LPXTG-motif cell wall-anchored protein
MNNRSHFKRLAAAAAAGGVVALAPVAMPAANAAPPGACQDYQSFVTTTTTLSISPANPDAGDAFTATASVTADGEAAQEGSVDFTYAGQTGSDEVDAGQASVTFTAVDGSNPLTAVYSGLCSADVLDTSTYTGLCSGGADVLGTSSDSQPVVLGVEGSAGGNGGAARPGATIGGVTGGSGGSSSGGLASTGVDSQTELYGLLGVGLVTVGGLTLMVHRRRVQG